MGHLGCSVAARKVATKLGNLKADLLLLVGFPLSQDVKDSVYVQIPGLAQAADAYDVADEVIASIGKTMDGKPFAEHLDWLVTSTAIHCARRGAELKGSAALQEEAGLSSELTVASRHCHEALEKYGFSTRYADHEPSGWKEIIEITRG